jgi:hypothetical protein
MMRQFSKFVNYRTFTGLKKTPRSAAAGQPSRVTPAAPPSENVEFDLTTLSWNETEGTLSETAEQLNDWFSGRRDYLPAGRHTADQDTANSWHDWVAEAGSVTFQGLTAASETAERLDALLCSGPQRSSGLEEEDPGCLNDIFWDLKLSNQSIHRW